MFFPHYVNMKTFNFSSYEHYFCRSLISICVKKKPQSSHLCLFLSSLSILCSLSSLSTRRRCRSAASDSWCCRYEDDRRPPRAGLETFATFVSLWYPTSRVPAEFLLTCHIRVRVYSCGCTEMKEDKKKKKKSADTCWRTAPPHLELLGGLCVPTGDVALPFLNDRKGKEKKNVTEWTSLTQLVAVKPGAKMKMTPCYITGNSAGATPEWPSLTTAGVLSVHKASTSLSKAENNMITSLMSRKKRKMRNQDGDNITRNDQRCKTQEFSMF